MPSTSRIPAIDVVDDRVVEVLRTKTPAERIAIADGLWSMASQMIHGIVAREHPDWPEPAIRREVARRISHGAL
ncbi:MAG: hypothetical protein ACYC61_08040 [Isosphaeraceae bacterium]